MPDLDGDGVGDGQDRCPLDAETFNGFRDDDGCPDRARPGRWRLDPDEHARRLAACNRRNTYRVKFISRRVDRISTRRPQATGTEYTRCGQDDPTCRDLDRYAVIELVLPDLKDEECPWVSGPQ